MIKRPEFHRLAAAALLAILTMTAAPASAGAEEIRWTPYREGMAAARNQGKKVFLHFYADWCGYCKKMAQESFQDREVIAYLNRNFISIRVDADREKQTAARYRVRALPATWFVSDRGQNISNRPGYVPRDTLLAILKYIHTDSYKHTSFPDFVSGQK